MFLENFETFKSVAAALYVHFKLIFLLGPYLGFPEPDLDPGLGLKLIISYPKHRTPCALFQK
jgi:hypothetical protein